jgi:hypothetical protein
MESVSVEPEKRKPEDLKEFCGRVVQRLPSDYMQTAGFLPPPWKVPLHDVRELVQLDETVSACLDFIQLAISSRIGEYCHDDPEIQEFVRLNFELLDGSTYSLYKSLLSMLWAGFACIEINTVFNGSKLWLYSLDEIPADTVLFHINQERGSLDYAKIDCIIQNYSLPNETKIPIEKCIYIKNDMPGVSSYDPYGVSRIKCIYSVLKNKFKLLKDWANALEKFGSPIIKYQLENGKKKVVNPDYPAKSSEKTATAEELAEAQILQQDKLKGWVYDKSSNIDLEFPPSELGKNFRDAVEYYNRMIMRGLLIPSLVLDNGDVGSYSLGSKHFELWQMSIDSITTNITETLLEQLIRPLIIANFGAVDSFGRFQLNETKEELNAWADMYNKIASLNVIDYNSIDDVNTIRGNVGLDPLDEDQIGELQAQGEAYAE